MRGAGIAACLALAGGSVAAAQGNAPYAGFDTSPTWTLDAPRPTAPHPKKAARPVPIVPGAAGINAEGAARLDAARRKFFEDQQAGKPKPVTVPEFGGYDAATMSGTVSPGFKF